MTGRKRCRLLVLLAIATLLAITACGSSDDVTSSTDDVSPDPNLETAESSDPDSATDGEVDAGTAADAEARSDDPLLPTSSDDEDSVESTDTSSAEDDGPEETEAGDDDPEPGASEQPPGSLPQTAEELTAALDEAELALRAPGITEDVARPWGQRQQYLYQVMFDNSSWADEVLASVDPTITDAVGHNWVARQNLSALVNSEELSEVLPAWTIVPPTPADELLGYYRDAGEATGIPWEVLASINLVETRMGRIRGISSAGAVGPMQFLPTTWAECCAGDPTKDSDAIRGAAEYLIDRGGAKDLDRAIFGYNNSDRYVAAVQAYAAVLMDNPDAYYGYHSWQVFFLSADGLVVLPEGYEEPEPVDVGDWLVKNPGALYEPAS